MSRIEALLSELAPNGVEFRALGDFAELVRGNGMPKADLTDAGIGAIHYGQIYTRYGVWTKSTFSFVSEATATKLAAASPGDIIITNTSENVEDVCKAVAWLGEAPIVTGGHATVIRHNQDAKFLSYWFQSESFQSQKRALATGTKVIDVSAKQLAKVRIPVPPLDVQREIVRILDTFSQLEAELEAELEARRAQYSYYRNSLLTFPEGAVSRIHLEDVCTKVSSGGTPPTGHAEYYNGDIPWLRTQEVDYAAITETSVKITDAGLRNSSAKWIPANCVIVAMYGATAAKVAVNAIPLTTNQACCNLQVDPAKANYRYVFHWIANEYERLKSLGEGSQSNINAKKIRDYPISLPPVAEQDRIVGILDKFDALVNSLSGGLPAELAARRKQYEYYRDRLLTFDEVPA